MKYLTLAIFMLFLFGCGSSETPKPKLLREIPFGKIKKIEIVGQERLETINETLMILKVTTKKTSIIIWDSRYPSIENIGSMALIQVFDNGSYRFSCKDCKYSYPIYEVSTERESSSSTIFLPMSMGD